MGASDTKPRYQSRHPAGSDSTTAREIPDIWRDREDRVHDVDNKRGGRTAGGQEQRKGNTRVHV